MLTTAYYFLQIILCSGLMMGYYWLVLRNKRFHQYNRFYLLAIALLSWVVPLIKIKYGHQLLLTDPQMMQLLSVLADNNSQIEEILTQKGFQWNWNEAASVLYFTVAGILLIGLLRALVSIYLLLKNHSCKSVGEVYLIITQAKGTPFSFFRYIFWNEKIDIRSEAGKQILQHELTHVHEKHSFDKIFIQLVLVVGWFNPFFWLIKKELEMIHEFIADRKAITEGDTASLAQMLLTAAYPSQQFSLTNPFFFSPIKRRLHMLTNHANPRFSYVRRMVVLPLLAIVVVLFAFRNKENNLPGTVSVESIVDQVVEKSKDLLNYQDQGESNMADTNLISIKSDTLRVNVNGEKIIVSNVTISAAPPPPPPLAPTRRSPSPLAAPPAPPILKNDIVITDIKLENVNEGSHTPNASGHGNRKVTVTNRNGNRTVTVTNRNVNGNQDTVGFKVEHEKLVTLTQSAPEFPGGEASWTKYLERNLNQVLVKKNGGPPGKYTVVVSFVIDKFGNISEVIAENDPGYGAKEEAMRVIMRGPRWKPAMQNGKAVIYRHKQSITFLVS